MSAYTFDNIVVDAVARRVTRGGEVVAIPDRHVGVLLHLVTHAGSLVSKDQLIESAWGGLAVTDNSLEQAISGLRRVLGAAPGGGPYIQTVPRQGYRFTSHIETVSRRALGRRAEMLRTGAAGRSGWLCAEFPGDRDALTVLTAAATGGHWHWRTWHLYPYRDESVIVETESRWQP